MVYSNTERNQIVNIAQIYRGIIDFGADAGLPAVNIRLAGCELTCSIEGTCKPSLTGGKHMPLEEIIKYITECRFSRVLICGGEPLIYPETLDLIEALRHEGLAVYLETSFTVDVDTMPEDISRLIDIKCPSNGTCYQTNWRMAHTLTNRDSVLFVVADRNDFIWCRDVLRRQADLQRTNLFIIPRPGEVSGNQLAAWILQDGLNIRLQRPLNIHISEKDLLVTS